MDDLTAELSQHIGNLLRRVHTELGPGWEILIRSQGGVILFVQLERTLPRRRGVSSAVREKRLIRGTYGEILDYLDSRSVKVTKVEEGI